MNKPPTLSSEQCAEIQERAGMVVRLDPLNARVITDSHCEKGTPEWYEDDDGPELRLHPDDYETLRRWAFDQEAC